jgi:bifunctional UDP-N-acetylglucosamine pyrophosphorylase/glucosamine-1-phosphate N-acetyltransferase
LLLLSGDVPLLTDASLQRLLRQHEAASAVATVLTAVVDNSHGYGRVVRSGGQISRIVEEKDATAAEREIREINSGIYAFDLAGLFDAIRSIAAENAQREYYLPDLVAIYRSRGQPVETVVVGNASEIAGINSRLELAAVGRTMRDMKSRELMAAGVTIADPATTYIDRNVRVGADTIIHPGVSLEGLTSIGAGSEIHSGSRIVNSQIGDRVVVYNVCVLTDAVVEDDARIGPFAHLRGHASVGPKAKVGNFVEMKKTRLGAASKSMHLTYLGDTEIGPNVNIGAGTITCNYDGTAKHRTTIEEGAFIGSDTQLIAPVTVGQGAYVGTGTTVRENVPPGALAVSAGKQRNIEGWVEKKGKGKSKK